MIGIAALPGLALAIGMHFAPSSPRRLVKQGRHNDARRVLQRIHGKDDVEGELHEMEEASKREPGYGGLLHSDVRPMRRGYRLCRHPRARDPWPEPGADTAEPRRLDMMRIPMNLNGDSD